MADPAPKPQNQLNPALKQTTEYTHDTTKSSIAPVDSASVQRDEGKAWPMIWLLATAVCVLIAVYLIFL